MKKRLCFAVMAFVPLILTGCSTMFTGIHQKVQVRTYHPEAGTKLDNVAKFDVISDGYRVKHEGIEAGENITVHRKSAPVVVRVVESACIKPSEERFEAGIHPAVIGDVVATSLLSTSIDSSTGAAWRYDETLTVTPRIKDTPECHEWLKKQVAQMNESVETKESAKASSVNQGGFPYDKDSVLHPYGYKVTK